MRCVRGKQRLNMSGPGNRWWRRHRVTESRRSRPIDQAAVEARRGQVTYLMPSDASGKSREFDRSRKATASFCSDTRAGKQISLMGPLIVDINIRFSLLIVVSRTMLAQWPRQTLAQADARAWNGWLELNSGSDVVMRAGVNSRLTQERTMSLVAGGRASAAAVNQFLVLCIIDLHNWLCNVYPTNAPPHCPTSSSTSGPERLRPVRPP